MTDDNILAEIREALDGRPGQPIVLGVCSALSQRLGFPAWGVRLATIVLGLFWTLPVLVAYVIAGFCMGETEARTSGFFAGLAVIAREWFEKITGAIQRLCNNSGPRSRSY